MKPNEALKNLRKHMKFIAGSLETDSITRDDLHTLHEVHVDAAEEFKIIDDWLTVGGF